MLVVSELSTNMTRSEPKLESFKNAGQEGTIVYLSTFYLNRKGEWFFVSYLSKVLLEVIPLLIRGPKLHDFQ